MVLGAAAEGVAKIIKDYNGYRRGQKKEDDLAVRKKLLSELDKSKNNLKNSLEYVHERENRKASKVIRKVLDEIDMFSNEVDLSEMGHHYPFFDPKKSIKKKDIENIIEFDKEILEACKDVTEATQEIQKKLIDGKNIDFDKEFNNIRQYITNVRNNYKDRLDYIKDIEPEDVEGDNHVN